MTSACRVASSFVALVLLATPGCGSSSSGGTGGGPGSGGASGSGGSKDAGVVSTGGVGAGAGGISADGTSAGEVGVGSGGGGGSGGALDAARDVAAPQLDVAVDMPANPDGGFGGGGADGGSGGRGGVGAGTGGLNGSAGAGGAGVAPTVVATLDYVPLSLALDGANLYVTVGSQSGVDGKVQTVAKTAVGATEAAGGGITTLASGLDNPVTIAVAGGFVYWAGTEAVFPNCYTTFAVPTAGGAVVDVTGGAVKCAITYSRIPIANSVLYTLTADYGSISAFPLPGAAGGAGQAIYTGTGTTLLGLDSDGTSVFFFVDIAPFAGQSNEIDLDQVPVGGGAATFLAKTDNMGTGDSHLIHDASTIYWSDRGTSVPGTCVVYALPKTGGTPTVLATFPTFTGAVQLVLDGNDFYAMSEFSLVRFPKTGGTPVTLASAPSLASADAYILSGPSNAIALVTDDTYVYWLWAGHGQILKLAK